MDIFSNKIEFSEEDQTYLKDIKRKIIHKKNKSLRTTLIVLIMLALIVFCYPIAIIFAVILIIYSIYIKNNKDHEHVASYEDIVAHVLRRRIPEADFYFRYEIMNPRELIEKDVLPTGNVSHTYWEFDVTKSDKYNFAISRVSVKDEKIWKDKTGKPHRTVEKIFNGLAFKIKLNKKIECPIKIVASEKKIAKESVGKYTPETEGWTKIEIESIAFNENFEVYAETEVGGFKGLEATLIEKFLKLKDKYGIFGCYVFENDLYFAFNDKKDLFQEPKTKRNIRKIKFEEIDQNIMNTLNIAIDVNNIINNKEK